MCVCVCVCVYVFVQDSVRCGVVWCGNFRMKLDVVRKVTAWQG